MEPSKDLKMFCNYRRLQHIKRCNNFPVINREDVAQHSYYVTLLAMIIADEYNNHAADNNMSYHPYDVEHHIQIVKVEEIMRKALLHDTEESITSDIPWNVKNADEETHHVIEQAIKRKIDSAYEGTTDIMQCYNEIGSKCKVGIEGQFVDIADMLELAMYCYEEVVMGNHYIKPLLDKCIRLVTENTLYNTLMEASPLFKSVVGLIECKDKTQMELQAEHLLDIG